MEIGGKIRALRLKNDLTQEELANRCELTKGFISQLENDLVNPSIDTLNDIIAVLGTDLGAFFADSAEEKIAFGKSDYFSKTREDSDIVWLVPSAQKNLMEPILLTLKRKGAAETDMPHEGEEFGYVMKGRVKLTAGGVEKTVKAGETFYFKAERKHSLENPSNAPATVLWISSPPNF